MRTIIMTIGLPASGKSTWAKKQVLAEPKRWVRLNKDDLRNMCHIGVWSPANEDIINDIQHDAVRAALAAGRDVILDNTHLNARARKAIYEIAEQVGDVTVIEKVFAEKIEVCLERNSKRTDDFVPEDAIWAMYKKAGLKKGYPEPRQEYFPPHNAAPYTQPTNCPKAILCDLDGTLADIRHRSPYASGQCEKDTLVEPVAGVVRDKYAQGWKIVFMSGRKDFYRPETDRWLKKHFGPEFKYELHMRTTNDNRQDAIVKRELFDKHVAGKYDVQFVLDDRPQVVRMWRYGLGLTVFQLNDKEF